MFHTDRLVLVEGKYDKIRLSPLIDAPIMPTEGFGVFKDKEKQRFIRKAAAERGLVVITDSDAAGFQIRRFLTDIAGENADVLQVYIPDVFGKEKRKDQPSKEGKLGVEGMDTAALEEALRRAGVFSEAPGERNADPITTADLYEAGLTGGPNAAEKRRAFLTALGLPARLTGKNLLLVLNSFLTKRQFLEKTEKSGA
jgi:ribonuclease M5